MSLTTVPSALLHPINAMLSPLVKSLIPGHLPSAKTGNVSCGSWFSQKVLGCSKHLVVEMQGRKGE